MDVTAEPAWLVAWRAGWGQPQRPAAPRAQPQSQGGQGGSGGEERKAAVAEAARPARPKGNYQGFVELELWTYDGGVRRESVLDCDYTPPRVVRVVGWHRSSARFGGAMTLIEGSLFAGQTACS